VRDAIKRGCRRSAADVCKLRLANGRRRLRPKAEDTPASSAVEGGCVKWMKGHASTAMHGHVTLSDDIFGKKSSRAPTSARCVTCSSPSGGRGTHESRGTARRKTAPDKKLYRQRVPARPVTAQRRSTCSWRRPLVGRLRAAMPAVLPKEGARAGPQARALRTRPDGALSCSTRLR